MTIIKGVDVFLDIAGGHRCTKVFELALHLDARACLVVLFRCLYSWDLLLLKGFSCLSAMAFYKVSVRFLFRLL